MVNLPGIENSFYEEAVRNEVCGHCIELGMDGACHGADPEGCAVFRHLPRMIRIARRLHKRELSPYVLAVRELVCTHCRERNRLEECALRADHDCALYRYLPLVIGALEKVNEGGRG